MEQTMVGIGSILIGLFTLAGAYFNWDWFMGHWKSRIFVKILGDNGARLFYIVFGVVIAGMGYFLF